MDKDKLKGIMQYNKYDGEMTSKLLGNTQATLSRKINEVDGSEFTRSDIEKMAIAWKLTEKQILEIFFCKCVEFKSTL